MQANPLEGTRFESHFDWAGETNLHPLGLAMVIVCGLATLAVPRKYALWPTILIACMVASAQRIVIATLDFSLLRIMVLFGWTRLILHGETAGFRWRPLDVWIVLWAASALTFSTILYGTFSHFVNRLGYAFDAVGMYFLFRMLIRDWEDLERTVLGLILISIPVVIAFLIENRTGRNAFAVFGGVAPITQIREGRLRCQGAFSHPILAGCFWASLMPLIAARFWRGRSYVPLAVVGLCTSTLIVLLCQSSTPVVVVGMTVIGGLFFYLRRRMRLIRWSFLGLLIALHLAMKAPVWHLLGRISPIPGSTGYQRFLVINEAVVHFREWWLLGVRSTVHWQVVDITNHFVLEGLRGGLLTLVLFIGVVSVGFQSVGRLWRTCVGDRGGLALAWALGVSLLAHCTAFIGVSYFGQIIVVWYMLLAAIASLSPAPREGLEAAGTRRGMHFPARFVARRPPARPAPAGAASPNAGPRK